MDFFTGYSILVGVMSLLGFLLMGFDKLCAKWNKRRIPEKTLLLVGALGGAAGSWLAMILFRHKTKHKAFSIGLPVLTVLHGVVFLLVITGGTRGGLE